VYVNSNFWLIGSDIWLRWRCDLFPFVNSGGCIQCRNSGIPIERLVRCRAEIVIMSYTDQSHTQNAVRMVCQVLYICDGLGNHASQRFLSKSVWYNCKQAANTAVYSQRTIKTGVGRSFIAASHTQTVIRSPKQCRFVCDILESLQQDAEMCQMQAITACRTDILGSLSGDILYRSGLCSLIVSVKRPSDAGYHATSSVGSKSVGLGWSWFGLDPA
jgi:hypothetical protein